MLDKYLVHGLNEQMHEGDICEAGTRTPEDLLASMPNSGARSWERPVADLFRHQKLRTGLGDPWLWGPPAVCLHPSFLFFVNP